MIRVAGSVGVAGVTGLGVIAPAIGFLGVGGIEIGEHHRLTAGECDGGSDEIVDQQVSEPFAGSVGSKGIDFSLFVAASLLAASFLIGLARRREQARGYNSPTSAL